MAVLRVFVIACLAGCYDPTLRDCTITCSGSGECASGQACHDGWCVTTTETTCGMGSADVVPLHVMVMGPGEVSIDATRTCSADCTYQVASGVAHELVATANADHAFQMWMGACTGTADTCTVTPPTAMAAVARFDGGSR